MSGHADALAQSVTDRKRQIGAQLVETTTAIQDALLSAGEVLFSLDKSLSWMSPVSWHYDGVESSDGNIGTYHSGSVPGTLDIL
jgi:hypothetical protein